MEKNYYEILEIDRNASEEIIDKAYRTLVKKYHPDLQDKEARNKYEEKMKKINEAYTILSDESARKKYDENLENDSITKEDYERILQENSILKQKLEELNNNTNVNTIGEYSDRVKADNIVDYYSEKMNRMIQQAYQDAYIQDMKNRGYRFKTRHTIKDYLRLIVSVTIIILIIFLIIQIPFVKKYFMQIYNDNIIIKAIVDMFVNTFKQFSIL